MTETTETPQVRHGITSALRGVHHNTQSASPAAVAEVVRVQLRTWVVQQWGVSPELLENPDVFKDVDGFGDVVGRVVRIAEANEEGDDDSTAWGMAHLIQADADAVRLVAGFGNGYALGSLYSLIVAAGWMWSGVYEGGSVPFTPYDPDRPVISERAVIETARTMVEMFTPSDAGVFIPHRGSWLDAPRFSDLIAELADSFEERYGDMDDDDSIRAMAHMVSAREHSLRAGYGHGTGEVLATIQALSLVIASASHL